MNDSEKLKQTRAEIERLKKLSKLIFDTKSLKAIENKIWELSDSGGYRMAERFGIKE